MCLGVQHHGAVRHSSGFITYRIMAYQRHLHIVSPSLRVAEGTTIS